MLAFGLPNFGPSLIQGALYIVLILGTVVCTELQGSNSFDVSMLRVQIKECECEVAAEVRSTLLGVDQRLAVLVQWSELGCSNLPDASRRGTVSLFSCR